MRTRSKRQPCVYSTSTRTSTGHSTNTRTVHSTSVDYCVQDRKDKAATKIEGRALLALLFPSLPAARLTYTEDGVGWMVVSRPLDDLCS